MKCSDMLLEIDKAMRGKGFVNSNELILDMQRKMEAVYKIVIELESFPGNNPVSVEYRKIGYLLRKELDK